MIIEMHSHTAEFSPCSHVKAVDLVRRACAKGLQGIVLTDHHHPWPPEQLAELRRQAQVPKIFFLASGQEVTTVDFGDVLVYGAGRTIGRGTPLAEIRRDFPQAALVWAHPYRDERHPEPERLLDPRLDAVEIFNSNHTHRENARGLRDWHRHRFTAVAGTDTHAVSYTGTFPTVFDHPVATVDELAAELRAGRCRPFFQELRREGGDAQVTALLLGPAAEEMIIIKEPEERQWEPAERAFHIQKELVRRGFESGPFRVAKPLGEDVDGHLLIEEGIRGRSLFDVLAAADAATAATALRLAARWLARLHNCRLRLTPAAGFLATETERLHHLISPFTKIGHRYTRRAREIIEAIVAMERERFEGRPDRLVQGHGDFNPRNILIGRDRGTRRPFVAAIDFNDSRPMPPALDVGTFLAHFRHQFFHAGEVLRNVSEGMFLEDYLAASEVAEDGFAAEVELFRARADMAIAFYLLQVGLGESDDLWRVLVDADHTLARLVAEGFSRGAGKPNL